MSNIVAKLTFMNPRTTVQSILDIYVINPSYERSNMQVVADTVAANKNYNIEYGDLMSIEIKHITINFSK